MRKASLVLINLGLLVALLFTATTAHADHPLTIERVEFPVTLSNQQTHTLVGYLYSEGTPKNRPLQVLLHGCTYNHSYWDAPVINDHSYSYARYMAEAGYAVLALDQLGSGESSVPDGDFLTVAESAGSIRQVLTSLRTKYNPIGKRFKKITLVGHSLGSWTALYSEGVLGHSVDGLVLTGVSVTPGASTLTYEDLAPFLGTPYLNVPPAARTALVYYTPNADPDLIAYDNTYMADTCSRASTLQVLDFVNTPSLLHVSTITAPVLIQLGAHDIAFPASLAPNEASFYSGAASVTVQTLPNDGHGFNLHLDNEVGWEQIEEWIDDNF